MPQPKLPLIIGLAIPVIMVIILAAIIYLPRLYLKPQYDFVYATGSYPSYYDIAAESRTVYRVNNGRLEETVQTDIKRDWPNPVETKPQFYRYSLAEKRNLPLSLEEASRLNLDPSTHAPDGFELAYANSDRNMFEAMFGEWDYRQRVLEKGTVAYPVDLVQGDQSSYIQNTSFVGWVIP